MSEPTADLTEATNQTGSEQIIHPGSLILVCGATGYVGGRLVPRLLEEGYRVRCFARSPQKLDEYPWRRHPKIEVCQGDLGDPGSIAAAAEGVDAAYYLVHSMISAGAKYAHRDRELARHFATAVRDAGVRRVVYLGGLGEMGKDLSLHLRSRREVESVLREHGVATTVLRAAMIIGSGSASFEILRYLVDRLPIMLVPKWVHTSTQPIAIRDVLRYLVSCLQVPETTGETIDIGGPEVLTYREMIDLMTDEIGLPRRVIVPVPVLSPGLSSRWIGLVTPVTSKIARPLSEGLRNRTVCRDDLATRQMPGPLLNAREAVDAALGKQVAGDIETRWSTAGEMPGDPSWSGGTVFHDQRETVVDASAETTFQTVCRIGGDHGYWGSDWLWRVRGWMDKLAGGPGLRRGRRDSQQIAFGEAIDFWRVSGLKSPSLLQLHAEMWLPGEAELQFRIEPAETGDADERSRQVPREPDGDVRAGAPRSADVPAGGGDRCRLIQTARFRPRGLLGIAYWYSVWPLHFLVFPTMLHGARREAERERS